MAKQQKPFTFDLPITRVVTKQLRKATEHVCNLRISGVAYFRMADNVNDRYDFDIDEIYIEQHGILGVDNLRDLLQVTGKWEDIEQAALNHVMGLFHDHLKTEAA